MQIEENLEVILVLSGIAMVTAGLIAGVFSLLGQQRKSQETETALVENALEFYCDITRFSLDRAFAKYQWYLAEIANFLTKYPKNQKFRK
jgi:hypothetical protein